MLYSGVLHSHNLVFLLLWIVFLPDVGAEVEDEKAEAAAKEDEHSASRSLKILTWFLALFSLATNGIVDITLSLLVGIICITCLMFKDRRNIHPKTLQIRRIHRRSSLAWSSLKDANELEV